ncbi:hypothetical protein H072_4086 [Dactylellina haptotyla CBS 200.50]|uniref:DH domain-containing protein n=1 Tax=Dactylellina haptotyla (strain CBS 200.50) TaxID=1284197 RepID=S8AFW7_DACHA|nr:hypothetical protein H072_4086 [Dactylellina haptotyla CBS 200.50]
MASISTTSTISPPGQAGSPVVTSPAASIGPSIPQVNDSIINAKADGSQSLFQICRHLQQRLETIPGMDKYLDMHMNPENPDPVQQIWQTFRSGAPLVLLYNALCPGKELKGSDEIPEALNKKKALVFQFLKNINEELHLSGDNTFIISNVYSDDTTGFTKVTKVVTMALDEIRRRGVLDTTGIASEVTDKSKMDKRELAVYEFLETERKYVQDLEALQDYKNKLQDAGIVSNDTIHKLFLNLNNLLDEELFNVYEPFCAKFKSAHDLSIQEAPKLKKLNHPLNDAGIGGFLIKPPQRICRYTLLLVGILKYTKDEAKLKELEEAHKIADRVNNRVNDSIRKQENADAAEDLGTRVEDWKGHQPEQFGDLLLFGQFTVIKGDAKGEDEREYHVYLFERILLCCKDKDAPRRRKPGPTQGKPAALQLKGRIYMQNVTDIISLAKNGSYTLQIFWKGDLGVENFIIRQRNEELLKQWNTWLHRQVALWKKDDQPNPERANRVQTSNNQFLWTEGAEVPRPDGDQVDADGEEEEERVDSEATSQPSLGGNQNAFPLPKQPKYPISSSAQYLQSQATTPISAGTPNGMSYFSPSESPMPTQGMPFRQTSGQYPFPKQGIHENGAAMARSTSREGTPLSASQAGQRIQRPSLPGIAQPLSSTQQNRMRSASSPNIHPLPASSPLGRAAMGTPPLPNMPVGYAPPSRLGTQSPSLYSQVQHLNTLPENPRASGMVPHISTMHQDYIPRNGTPPAIGPDGTPLQTRQVPVPSLKVKVSYITDMFIIIVPQNIGYSQLMDRIERKVRLCGGPSYSSKTPLRVRYQDEDGDYITVHSDEDVQMAIESRFHGGEAASNAVTLFVA